MDMQLVGNILPQPLELPSPGKWALKQKPATCGWRSDRLRGAGRQLYAFYFMKDKQQQEKQSPDIWLKWNFMDANYSSFTESTGSFVVCL